MHSLPSVSEVVKQVTVNRHCIIPLALLWGQENTPKLAGRPAAEPIKEIPDRAAKAVKKIQVPIRAGDVIISPGEVVTQKHLDMLRAEGLMNPAVQYSQAAAVVVLLGLLVYCLFYFARRASPKPLHGFHGGGNGLDGGFRPAQVDGSR